MNAIIWVSKRGVVKATIHGKSELRLLGGTKTDTLNHVYTVPKFAHNFVFDSKLSDDDYKILFTKQDFILLKET